MGLLNFGLGATTASGAAPVLAAGYQVIVPPQTTNVNSQIIVAITGGTLLNTPLVVTINDGVGASIGGPATINNGQTTATIAYTPTVSGLHSPTASHTGGNSGVLDPTVTPFTVVASAPTGAIAFNAAGYTVLFPPQTQSVSSQVFVAITGGSALVNPLVVTITDANANIGGTVTINNGATVGSTTYLPTTSGSHTPIASHTGGNTGMGDPTIATFTAVAPPSTGAIPTNVSSYNVYVPSQIQGSPSQVFVAVSGGSALTTPLVVTLVDANANIGGTVTINNGSTAGSTTYTPTTSGVHTMTCSHTGGNAGITDPTIGSFTVAPSAAYAPVNANGYNVYVPPQIQGVSSQVFVAITGGSALVNPLVVTLTDSNATIGGIVTINNGSTVGSTSYLPTTSGSHTLTSTHTGGNTGLSDPSIPTFTVSPSSSAPPVNANGYTVFVPSQTQGTPSQIFVAISGGFNLATPLVVNFTDSNATLGGSVTINNGFTTGSTTYTPNTSGTHNLTVSHSGGNTGMTDPTIAAFVVAPSSSSLSSNVNGYNVFVPPQIQGVLSQVFVATSGGFNLASPLVVTLTDSNATIAGTVTINNGATVGSTAYTPNTSGSHTVTASHTGGNASITDPTVPAFTVAPSSSAPALNANGYTVFVPSQSQGVASQVFVAISGGFNLATPLVVTLADTNATIGGPVTITNGNTTGSTAYTPNTSGSHTLTASHTGGNAGMADPTIAPFTVAPSAVAISTTATGYNVFVPPLTQNVQSTVYVALSGGSTLVNPLVVTLADSNSTFGGTVTINNGMTVGSTTIFPNTSGSHTMTASHTGGNTGMTDATIGGFTVSPPANTGVAPTNALGYTVSVPPQIQNIASQVFVTISGGSALITPLVVTLTDPNGTFGGPVTINNGQTTGLTSYTPTLFGSHTITATHTGGNTGMTDPTIAPFTAAVPTPASGSSVQAGVMISNNITHTVFDNFVSTEYGRPYNYITNQDMIVGQNSNTFLGSAAPMDTYSQNKLNAFKNGTHVYPNIAGILINDLVAQGILQPGSYRITYGY